MPMLLALWVLLRIAFAAPTIEAAPDALGDRPVVSAPAGGWWTEDGLWARVHGEYADRETVRRLATHANASVPALATRLGVAAGGLLDVYLAPDQAAFD